MKRFLVFLVSFFAVSAFADLYVLVDLNRDSVMYFQSDPGQVRSSGYGLYVVPLTPAQYATGWQNLPGATRTNLFDTAYSNYHSGKADLLKVSENTAIEFLQRAGYISTNAVAVPSGMQASVMTNLIALGRSNPTSSVVDNLISRFHSCIDLLTDNNGTLDDAVWHPGY